MCWGFCTVNTTCPTIALSVATASSWDTFSRFLLNDFVFTLNSLSPILRRPSTAAAPPSIIFVTYIPLSPGMCWLPMPPAIEKPKPRSPFTRSISLICVAAGGFFLLMTLKRKQFLRIHQPLTFQFTTYEFNSLASRFQRLDCARMRNINNRNIIYGNNDIINMYAAVSESRAALNNLCDINWWIGAGVWRVCSTGYGES